MQIVNLLESAWDATWGEKMAAVLDVGHRNPLKGQICLLSFVNPLRLFALALSEQLSMALQDGFAATAFGLVALEKMVKSKHTQQERASEVLEACRACIRVAHRALFCPRCAEDLLNLVGILTI